MAKCCSEGNGWDMLPPLGGAKGLNFLKKKMFASGNRTLEHTFGVNHSKDLVARDCCSCCSMQFDENFVADQF